MYSPSSLMDRLHRTLLNTNFGSWGGGPPPSPFNLINNNNNNNNNNNPFSFFSSLQGLNRPTHPFFSSVVPSASNIPIGDGDEDSELAHAISMSMEAPEQVARENEKQEQLEMQEESKSLLQEENSLQEALRLSKIEEQREQERQLRYYLREEQDKAYLESLQRDQEKEAMRIQEQERLREEQEQLEMQEAVCLSKELSQESTLQRKLQYMKEEPTRSPETTQLVIRMADGSKISRNFWRTDTLHHVKDFIDTRKLVGANVPENFQLVTDFPRKAFTDLSVTLEQAGLIPNAVVSVHTL